MPRSTKPTNYPSWMHRLADSIVAQAAPDTIELNFPNEKDCKKNKWNIYGFIKALGHEAERSRKKGDMKEAKMWQDRANGMRKYIIQHPSPKTLLLSNRSTTDVAKDINLQLDAQLKTSQKTNATYPFPYALYPEDET